mmetsp:Transcript_17757/g.32029  ORF Transcript_17757/g.32029 Transcript_17757/m.32029 type:complete len:109 (-) Transcript_17757:16-342(-)
MTALDPMYVEVVPTEYDRFGRPAKVYGRCSSNGREFIIILFLLNYGMACLSFKQLWNARHLSTQYQESHSIFRALVCIFMVTLVGLPVMAATRESYTTNVLVITILYL